MFREKATLSPSDPAAEQAIKHAEEVAAFLRSNVVQGKKEGDVYSTLPLQLLNRGVTAEAIRSSAA